VGSEGNYHGSRKRYTVNALPVDEEKLSGLRWHAHSDPDDSGSGYISIGLVYVEEEIGWR